MTDVTCNEARELISARLDGETNAADHAAIDHHTAHCMNCHRYEQVAFDLRRALQLRAVEPATDDAPAVDLVGSLRTMSMLRTTLFVIGGTLVILNLSSIVSPGGTTGEHLSRHDGIFGTALGIAMLAVAAKPHRAIGLVPLTSAIAVLMSIAATTDLVNGKANLLSESIHVVEFAGLICLWVISGGPSRLPRHLETITRRMPAFSASAAGPTTTFDGPKGLS